MVILRIEHWMEELSDLPARIRRTLIPTGAVAARRGMLFTQEPHRQVAKAYAAAAYEPKGVWRIGINYHASPVGCQDCCHANWSGDSVTCGWEVTPSATKVTYAHGPGPSYDQRMAQAKAQAVRWAHTAPKAFLEYAKSKGALGVDGRIDTDLIYRQCSECDPLEEDDDES